MNDSAEARGPIARPPRVVVLVGLPGAGKTTVGRLVARKLDAEFVDLDDLIETAAGKTIPAIFATEGEEGFRARERAATREIASHGPLLVLAPGGGWVEDRGNLGALGGDVETIYLRISVPVAVERIFLSGKSRPLLGGPDPAFRLQELLARREALYLQSNHTLSVDSMTPEAVAASIVAIARRQGGD